MNKNTGWIITVVLLSLVLIFTLVFGSAGSFTSLQSVDASTPTGVSFVTSTPSPIYTPDQCSPEGIVVQVGRVHALTREFEDTAQLLTSTLLRDTSVDLVKDLQRIRRSAEDQVVPSCLNNLKQYQIAHMNARINVFGSALAFLNAYGPNGDQNALNQLLAPLWPIEQAAARQYENEYYRLLGVTATPAPTVVPIIATPTP